MKGDPHQNVRLAVQRDGDPGAAEGRPSLDSEPPNAAWLEQRRLVHELEVHQVELEIQNRAMGENQELLEESRARYATLYDYAPVGHVALDRQGIIRELNLTCAALLGEDRRLLAGRPFRLFLAPASRRAFDDHLRLCFANRRPSSVELAIPETAHQVEADVAPQESGPRIASRATSVSVQEGRTGARGRADRVPYLYHIDGNPGLLEVIPSDQGPVTEPVKALQLRENGCGRGKNRTFNKRIKSPLLCQLSYTPEIFSFQFFCSSVRSR
jgi:PAS domain S-box-containing protein